MKSGGATHRAAVVGVSLLFVAPLVAQQVTGDLARRAPPPPSTGSSSRRRRRLRRRDQGDATDSKPWWPPRVVPPKGAPNVLLIMTDDQGYGVSGTFGGVIPTPALDRVAKTGLRYTQFHSTALCSPTRAALITGRNHHSVGFGVISELSTGYPGLRLRHRSRQRDDRRDPEGQRLCHLVVRQEPQHARLPVQRRRARSTSGRRAWASSISTASWAAKPTSGQPYLFQDHTQIFPWIGKPGYNLTTDMADDAIDHMRS